MTTRMRLRRADGRVYMERWGLEANEVRKRVQDGLPFWKRLNVGAIYLHRFTAPDPGVDLHDHPWTFWTLILRGGYSEERADTREAPTYARLADQYGDGCRRGIEVHHGQLSVRRLGVTECHRITTLDRPVVWSLVIAGPWRRRWGFYTPDGYIDSDEYDRTVRRTRRDLATEVVGSQLALRERVER